jgi:hypothetical protein
MPYRNRTARPIQVSSRCGWGLLASQAAPSIRINQAGSCRRDRRGRRWAGWISVAGGPPAACASPRTAARHRPPWCSALRNAFRHQSGRHPVITGRGHGQDLSAPQQRPRAGPEAPTDSSYRGALTRKRDPGQRGSFRHDRIPRSCGLQRFLARPPLTPHLSVAEALSEGLRGLGRSASDLPRGRSSTELPFIPTTSGGRLPSITIVPQLEPHYGFRLKWVPFWSTLRFAGCNRSVPSLAQ